MADMTRSEQLLNAIATGEPSGCAAMTRREKFLAYLAGECDAPPSKVYTREERLLAKICANGPGSGGGGGASGNEFVTDTSKNYGNEFIKLYKMSDELVTVKEVETATFEVDGKPSDIVLSQTETPVGYNMCVNSEFTMGVLIAMDESTNVYFDASTYVTVPKGTYSIALAGSFITKMIYTKEPGKPYIDTSKITDFTRFCQINRMDNLLEYLDTSNGTNFSEMFYRCTSLTTAPLLDTSKGTSFSNMFCECSQLQTVPQFDTSKGTDFSDMFYGCTSLTTAPLLDTSKGTSFSDMFHFCSQLQTVPQFDTSKGTKFDRMFCYCSQLQTVPQLDTSNGTNFSEMFYRCTSLTTAPLLDISGVSSNWSFGGVFNGCTALETVSLTTAKINLSTNTFQDCTALKNLTIGKGWAVSIYLHYSNNLTVESLHGMIENLADLTGQTAKTFQIGATNLAKIDEAHLAMLDAKNWEYS